jgi:NADH dehydrogenase
MHLLQDCCRADSLLQADGQRIEAGTIIWAAGVVASPAAAWVDADRDRAGRVKVGSDLSVPGKPNVFVIGDTAAVDTQGHPVPGVAPAAEQMGRYVGRLIRSRIEGQPLNEPFRIVTRGTWQRSAAGTPW